MQPEQQPPQNPGQVPPMGTPPPSIYEPTVPGQPVVAPAPNGYPGAPGTTGMPGGPMPGGSVDPAAAFKADDYEFIVSPGKKKLNMPGGMNGSAKGRILVAAVGVVILLIIGSVAKTLLTPKDTLYPALLKVATAQQQLLQIAQVDTVDVNNLSVTNANFNVTCGVVIAGEQKDMLAYFTANKHKVTTLILKQRLNADLSAQLKDAKATGTFNTVYTSIMRDQLLAYQNAIAAAFKVATGPKAKALLQADFTQSQLLATQLNAPDTTVAQ